MSTAATESGRTVHTAEALPFLLHRERGRAERTGHEFALVVFEDPHGWIDQPTGRHVLSLLSRSVRLTDEVAWFDTRRLCAVLPETPAEGAHRFAMRMGESLADAGLQLTREIYVYPSRWFGGPPLPSDPHHRGDRNNRDDDGAGGHSTAAPYGGRSQRRAALEAAVEHAIARSDAQAAAQPLEPLYARPLPRWKRWMDIIGSAMLLLLAAPVLLVAALAVRLSSPGPVIFRQERAGLGGRPFWMLKFRTMVDGAEKQQEVLRPLSEQDGPAFKLRNDPRITRVGRWLRKTSIDEAPQLFNVLRGDMSLVGPRPLPCRESDECSQWHRARLDVTPGLTCIWQVNGRSNTDFDRWVRMDLDYIRRRSFRLDLKLLMLTVPAVLLQRGAH